MIDNRLTFTKSQAIVEAERCLSCYEAPCTQACPAGVDIPGFIRRFRENNLVGASELIYSACPLGSTCGNACPTTVLCESACVLPKQGQTSIRIGALQTFITTAYRPIEVSAAIHKGYRVAVIGAGPSGLGCAIQLNRLGVKVDLYDREVIAGGMVSKVIPSHRLPQNSVDIDLERIFQTNIKNIIQKNVDADEIKEMASDYDAVFLGFGLADLVIPHLDGENAKNVFTAMHILEGARKNQEGKNSSLQLGKKVIIVGGGNVALDAAIVAKKFGAEQVIVVYRRTKNEMPGWTSEYLEACSIGVEFRWLSTVSRIIFESGELKGVEIQPMKFTDINAQGRRSVINNGDENISTMMCDTLVFALGQKVNKIIDDLGINGPDGLISTQNGTYMTNIEGVFAAGEAVIGGSTIVASMKSGMNAGKDIFEWLIKQNPDKVKYD
jgi:dihydropyrimidine dehydrogenase (NAD+) subunit PreT